MIWLWVLAGAAALLLAVTYISYRIPFYHPLPHREDPYDLPPGEQYQHQREEMLALIGEMDAIPCQRVGITSYDGTPLVARYYHVADGAPLQIEFHGWHGSAIRDFCGGNKLARQMGMNTLLVDQRAHGGSGGRTITFGLRERYDCLAWCRYAVQRWPDVPITLAGVSMGAATVLMAAGLDLPEQVVGIIADSPYSSPADIIGKVCRDEHLPAGLMMPFIVLGARLFGRFDLRETTAAREMAKAKVPVLILHGEDDRFVPCDMSREVLDAAPALVRRVTFPGAGHGLSYITDPEGYRQAVIRFCRDMVRS